jgi:hypothetical protein
MEHKTNIFFHATKELSTDAFLVWLIYFLDSEEKYSTYKQHFFDNLILKKEDCGKKVHDIELKRQENSVDVILTFKLGEINEKKTVLFENKTWTTFHDNQLENYRSIYPHSYRYIYLKLAYINSNEEKEVKSFGYDIIDASMFSKVIGKFEDIHLLIKMYNEYITETFVNKINSYHDEIFMCHNYEILCNPGAQQYLCDIIATKLVAQNVPYLGITNGTSAGRPWTEILLTQKEDGYWECLFWRIDIRSEKFYIRLNQYSEPLDEQVSYKMRRLEILRKEAEKYVANIPELHLGIVNNRARNESEVMIFFFIENDLDILLEALPKISSYMIEVFNKLP